MEPWKAVVESMGRLSEKVDETPVFREATLVSQGVVRFDIDSEDTEVHASLAGSAAVGSRVLTVMVKHYIWVLGVKGGDAGGNSGGGGSSSPTGATTLWVNSAFGTDGNFGRTQDTPLKTLGGLRTVLDGFTTEMLRGVWDIQLAGTFNKGIEFPTLPLHRSRILFTGEPLDEDGRPQTWIESSGAAADRFGMRFEPGEGSRLELNNLGMRGFATGGGYGWLQKEGGFMRTRGMETEDCQIGSGYVGRVGFSEIGSKHRGYTTSGTRAQYSSTGSWTEVDVSGGGSEGFHVSRGAHVHIDKAIAKENSRDGVWANDDGRAAIAGGVFHRNGREGVRGEGTMEIHLDNTTYGVIDFGTGDYAAGGTANGRRGIGLYGNARHTATQSVYGTVPMVVSRKVGEWQADGGVGAGPRVTSDRGLMGPRVGDGAILEIKAWGRGGGQLNLAIGGASIGTFDVPQTWVVETKLQYLDGAWRGLREISGGVGTTPVGPHTWPKGQEAIPSVLPRDTCILVGVEFAIGG